MLTKLWPTVRSGGEIVYHQQELQVRPGLFFWTPSRTPQIKSVFQRQKVATVLLSHISLLNSVSAEVASNKDMMGTTVPPSDQYTFLNGEVPSMQRSPSADRREDEREEREMFSKLEKPRVRYDVEVVTKLIVYAGMFCPDGRL